MTTRLAPKKSSLIVHYQTAKSWIEQSRYLSEVSWLKGASGSVLTESNFLREYAWVVLNSGFREAIVRKHFDYISLAFCDWSSAQEISNNAEGCIAAARVVFSHRLKLSAIVQTAKLLDDWSFERFAVQLRNEGVGFLERLPFIGSITSWHLAKNIGLNVAKPDRHMIRLAGRFGYSDVQIMCTEIANVTGDDMSVADLILWRFAVETAKSRSSSRRNSDRLVNAA